MEKSESIKNLAGALSKFQSEMQSITKDAENPFFKSKYASLSAIIEDTRGPLGTNGLSYAQFPIGENGLTTLLMHNSGEFLSATYEMKPVDQKPQSVGSALTYMRRYALCSVLGLQVDDDDGNEATGKKAPANVIQVPLGKGEKVGKVVVSGTDTDEPARPQPWKKPTFTEQKKAIQKFLDQQSLVELSTKEDYEGACLQITGLKLEAPNYEKIIERLFALQIEHEAA